jgi:hypothetical protein
LEVYFPSADFRQGSPNNEVFDEGRCMTQASSDHPSALPMIKVRLVLGELGGKMNKNGGRVPVPFKVSPDLNHPVGGGSPRLDFSYVHRDFSLKVLFRNILSFFLDPIEPAGGG